MSVVLTASSGDLAGDVVAMNGMFALRHKIFSERLGWDVKSEEGMEKDYFDDLDPTYVLVKDEKDVVEGCWRVLPTTGPYMLKDVFPMLLRGEEAPNSPDVWEISRFAVMPPDGEAGIQAGIQPATIEILRQGYKFAVERGIKRYVAVTSVAMERFLVRVVGVPMTRLGDQKSQYVGKTLSVACWIEIDDRLYKALFEKEIML